VITLGIQVPVHLANVTQVPPLIIITSQGWWLLARRACQAGIGFAVQGPLPISLNRARWEAYPACT
jgi:hypothetical protein